MPYIGGMTVADLYVRKSTKDKGRSLTSQEEESTADILAERWTLGRLFSDPELSASRYARKSRPDFDALVKHIEAGDCKILVLWEASRGSRRLSEWIDLLDSCRVGGILIRITSHHRTYDVRNRRDYRTLVEEGVDADDESARTSERVRRTLRSQAAVGLPFGRVTYGYKRIYNGRGQYLETVEHEDQAPIVREVARRLLKGNSATEIAKDLNRRGIATPHGDGAWSATQVSRMPTYPIYSGRRMHLGEHVTAGKWPVILDEVTWQRCVKMLKDPDRRSHRGTRLKYNLAGVAKCGRCGGLLRTGAVPGRRLYLCAGCGKVSVSAETFDGIIIPMVLDWARSHDLSFLYAAPADDPEALAARAEAEELTARLDAHYERAATGELSAGGLVAMEKRLLPQIAAARRRAERAGGPTPLWELEGVDIVEEWDDLSVAIQRRIILGCSEIVVDPAVRGGRYFDTRRLVRSRWRGETQTWGDLWAAGQGVD